MRRLKGGTTAGDIPGVSPTDAACKMGGGAVISLTDMRTVYPKDYFRRAMALGKENNIPVQPKTVPYGRQTRAPFTFPAAA